MGFFWGAGELIRGALDTIIMISVRLFCYNHLLLTKLDPVITAITLGMFLSLFRFFFLNHNSLPADLN